MPNDGTTLLQEAVQAARRGDSGGARSLLLRASSIEPSNDLVWLWLAHLAASTTDRVHYLRRVLDAHPGHEVASAELAAVLTSQGIEAAKAGNKPLALRLLEESVELDPNREESWLWLAAVAATRERQRECLERVLSLDPNHRHALALLELPEFKSSAAPSGNRCPICRAVGSFADGRCRWCKSVLSLTDLRSLLRNRELDRALVEPGLKRLEALPGATENYDVLLAAGLAALNLGLVEQGIARLEAALHLRPDDELLATQVEVLSVWRRGRTETAPKVEPIGRVLVVDDSPTVRKLVAACLEARGVFVATANDGLEALAKLRDERPDLILLDINLPGMDGYQICRIVKGDPSRASIPVVFLSGRNGLFDRVRGRLAGSLDYISKPFEPQALGDQVLRWIAAGKAP
jgi:twitching motility two-component system response regulator PilG